jgi:hypothetical protein
VPDTDKEDGELDRDRKLRDVGVIVDDVVVFDEFCETVEDKW